MNDRDDRQLEEALAEALADDDPAAALEALTRRYAGRPDRAERVHQARAIVADLSALGKRLEGTDVPPLGELELAPARPVWRTGALRWASAVAAAIVAALLLWMAAAPPQDQSAQPPGLSLEIPPLTWQVPSISPVSLAGESFTLPEVTIPSTSSVDLSWTVPPVHLLPYSERSSSHETNNGA